MAARFGVAGTWCAHPASNPMASPASADLNSIVVMFFLPVETTSVDSPRQSNASPRQTRQARPSHKHTNRNVRPLNPGHADESVQRLEIGNPATHAHILRRIHTALPSKSDEGETGDVGNGRGGTGQPLRCAETRLQHAKRLPGSLMRSLEIARKPQVIDCAGAKQACLYLILSEFEPLHHLAE